VSTKQSGKILIIDDNPDVLIAAKIVLKKQFSSIHTEPNPEQLSEILETHNFDVILLDMNYSAGATSGDEGIKCLNTILKQSPESKVILMTAYAGVEVAIRAIKEGATDFVIKPWDNDRLLATVLAAARHGQSDREVKQLQSRQRKMAQMMGENSKEIIGESESLKHVLKEISKVASTNANVLILGENGTGKELIARAIHQQSLRCDQAFVNVDIGAISKSLFESELFGHKKGAFTDAINDRAGRFEIASDGTLFLDEIGNLDPQMQAKLLGAIQNMEISRVGSDTPIKVDCRLISATNMPLYEMVDESLFRQDLLYRINTVEIRVPALRERLSDIPILTQHFVDIYSRKYHREDITLDNNCLSKLHDYHWPGNVRELQHTVERAVIMAENNVLQPEDFLLKTTKPMIAQNTSFNLEELEKTTIERAIHKHSGNLSKAAQELGLARSTLYRKMTKHGL
jgi:two-component system response regulator HydG